MGRGSRRGRQAALGLVLVVATWGAACGSGLGTGDGGGDGRARVVFRHFRVFGGEEPLAELLARFERENPDVDVVDAVLPSSSDQQHQFYVTQLEGGAPDFDVFALDVVWVPELARAGWLRPLSALAAEGPGDDLLAPARRAATWDGELWAVPWFVDAGLFYYRKDLLAARGLAPPATWDELAPAVRTVLAAEGRGDLTGFVWQGRQYEGLVCAALEVVRAHGGRVLADGRCALGEESALEALAFLRRLVEGGVSPPLVTTMDEEGARRLFQAGDAVFMRNWPYAMELLEREGSPVRGLVGVAPVPAAAGRPSVPTLGGWCLGVRRGTPHPEAAERLVRFLVGVEAQGRLATGAGLLPSRASVYADPAFARERPFAASLLEVLRRAEPRPVTPYYPMLARILQSELSAVVTGLRTPDEAAARACAQIERVLALEEGAW